MLGGILAAAVWIYLFRMVRKQKNSVFNEQMGSKISEWHLKWLKVLLIAGGISFLVFIIGVLVHNVSHGLSEIEEPVFFIIALAALLLFIVTTAGGMIIFLKGRQKTT